MRILWVGKAPSGGNAGDEVYDRKLMAAMTAEGAELRKLSPQRAGPLLRLLNLATGVPHYRNSYSTHANRTMLANRTIPSGAADHAVAVVSWEPFDGLAYGMTGPVIPILHNVTSTALPSMFPGNPVAGLLAAGARRWERRIYGAGRFAAIGVLSVADQDYVRSIAGDTDVVLLYPGMPDPVDLAEDAGFSGDIVLSGTFDWKPKRRDVVRFAHEYRELPDRWPVYVDDVEAIRHALPDARPCSSLDWASAIRIGIITDRFQAGYKLKTTHYIAHNAIVMSYADISRDFDGLPDHAFFIRTIRRAEDLAGHVEDIMRVPQPELVARMRRFKQACSERFSWSGSGRRLMTAARAAVSSDRAVTG